MRLLDKKAMEDLITILWNSWNNRNNVIFRGKEEETRVVWERALTLSNDFQNGFRVITRDDEGIVVGGCGGSKELTLNSEWVELMALEEGDIMILWQRAYDTCMQLKTFEATDVTWAPKSCNNIVDFIWNYVLNNNCSWDFDVNYHKEIHKFVIHDAID
ncbi:hypothetical protein Gotri_002785 [Gossypium trilobum]|uniref:RNase H type-1 domain-containing protein n=1 Tax=Gossypium trilobum TaxID=34281 RepID=A0A7J9FAC5_9ROSI|nr:hypothetical protein [Gossypium trilobum]